MSRRATSVLDTPALLLELERMKANFAHIAASCRAHEVCWWPNLEGHKTIEMFRKQMGTG